MLDKSSADRVRTKLAGLADLLSQASSEKAYAWHRLTAGGTQLAEDERFGATREYVEAQNKFERHAASARMCAASLG